MSIDFISNEPVLPQLLIIQSRNIPLPIPLQSLQHIVTMKSLISLTYSLHYAIAIFLVVLNPVSPTAYPECTPVPAPATAPAPIPSSALVDYYYQPPSQQSPADALSLQVSVIQIRNKLSLYFLALDGKNLTGLDYILTEDVVANYSTPIGVVKGLANVKEAIAKSLQGVDTQDLLGTQVIDVDPQNPCTAKSLTYFAATFFGTGDQKGKV